MTKSDLSPLELEGVAEFVRRKWNVQSHRALENGVDYFLRTHPDADHLIAAIRAAAPDMETMR